MVGAAELRQGCTGCVVILGLLFLYTSPCRQSDYFAGHPPRSWRVQAHCTFSPYRHPMPSQSGLVLVARIVAPVLHDVGNVKWLLPCIPTVVFR